MFKALLQIRDSTDGAKSRKSRYNEHTFLGKSL